MVHPHLLSGAMLLALGCAPAPDSADTGPGPGDTGDTADTAEPASTPEAQAKQARTSRHAPRSLAARPTPLPADQAPLHQPEGVLAALFDKLSSLGEAGPAPEGATLAGDLVVRGPDGLAQLRGVGRIEGALRIDGTDLTDLDGLEGLTRVGGLVLRDNPRLHSLAGLAGLRIVDEVFYLEDNPSLFDLGGLEALERVGVEMTVLNNTALRDISALSGLRSVGTERGWCGNGDAPALAVFHNDLASLAPLEGLEAVNGPVNVRDNGALSPAEQQDFAARVPAWPCEVSGTAGGGPGLLRPREPYLRDLGAAQEPYKGAWYDFDDDPPQPFGDPIPGSKHHWNAQRGEFEYIFD